jgi:hypothetical protein
MFVCCECCVLSCRGLCEELITRPEESYRMWCVNVCDLEPSWMSKPWSALGRNPKIPMFICLSSAQWMCILASEGKDPHILKFDIRWEQAFCFSVLLLLHLGERFYCYKLESSVKHRAMGKSKSRILPCR